ncbi:C13 family peptidase [Andreprevotia chitinilytica]|uniref:C13 family peptidase n=1 Tax=Andreprevotia chitinilytica TaxID=396808 RepID=UPI000691216F|nr:C13 family peptidase [Andreprevotia chitinilytica]
MPFLKPALAACLLVLLAGCASISPQSPALLQQQLARVEPTDAKQPHIYLIAVAGFDTPKVFGQEAEYVTSVFVRQLGAANRVVILNNRHLDAERYPQVNRDLLRQAILGIAAKMNRQDDVLALYLTSHGSHEGNFMLHPPTSYRSPAEPVSPQWLKDTLAEAGIRWRMVFVSACYSGRFRDVLRDERSLIITAADANHPSFGCSNDVDYTYFGKAMFVDQDFAQPDWAKLFANAAEKIIERENEQGILVHSSPQFWFGPQLADHLTEIESRQ